MVYKAPGFSLPTPPSPLPQISHRVLPTLSLLKHSSLLSVGLYKCRCLYLKYPSSSPTLHLHCYILTFSLGFPMPKLSVMQRISIFFHSELTIILKAQWFPLQLPDTPSKYTRNAFPQKRGEKHGCQSDFRIPTLIYVTLQRTLMKSLKTHSHKGMM